MEGAGGAHPAFTSTCVSETCSVRAPRRLKTQGERLPGSRTGKASAQGRQWPLVDTLFRFLRTEASRGGEAPAVRKAKIDLQARMWLLLPNCGPDARLPGEDSRDATASFFRPHRFSQLEKPPFRGTSGIYKMRTKKGMVGEAQGTPL